MMGSKNRKRKAADSVDADELPKAKKYQQSKSTSSPAALQLDLVPSDFRFVLQPQKNDLKLEVAFYDQLASEDSSERLRAATTVVSGLVGFPPADEAVLYKHLERRLFRGLASGRRAARLGFSVVATEVLRALFGDDEATSARPSLTFDRVLAMLVAKTKPEGDLSGQEERDHYLGLLFGLQSFVRAKVLCGDGRSGRWESVLAKLLELAGKKPWMREECGWVVVEALSQMTISEAERTLVSVEAAGLAAGPEGVGIWLAARERFPSMRFSGKTWGSNGDPLMQLKKLAKALKESSGTDGEQAKQTGSWNAKLHFVWDLVMGRFLNDFKAGKDGVEKEFENFWKVAVDENLFAASASRERKFWGFLLFQKMLQDAAQYPQILQTLFSNNLIRCFMNHLSEKDRFLNRAAEKSMKVILQTVESVPSSIVTILPNLIGENGVYNFDQVTKTKSIETMLGAMQSRSAEAVVEILQKPIIQLEADENEENYRRTYADYLLTMIRRLNMADDSIDKSWIETAALPSLFGFAYGSVRPTPKPPLSDKSREMFQSRLMSAISHLITDQSGFLYSCNLLGSLSPEGITMDGQLVKAKDEALSTMQKLLKKAKNSGVNEKKSLKALALLYSIVIFQLYSGESETVSVLEELQVCYDRLIKRSEALDDDASQILVEVLLSFLSKPSALLRRVALAVFTAFASEITAEGLKLMTDVLESSESLRGQQELFDQNEAEENDGDEDSASMDSDVETIDVNGVDGDANSDQAEDGSEDDAENEENAEDEEDDEADEESAKLDAALAEALGTNGLNTDGPASDSDADMTDSEMLALDSKLVEIFKQRKALPNKKKEKQAAKTTIISFKTRILDLLDAYVRIQAYNPVAFDILLPLLRLIRTTSSKPLSMKAHAVLSTFAKSAKQGKVDNEQTTQAHFDTILRLDLLRAIHDEASRDPANTFSRAASTASLLVAASLWRVDKANLEAIAAIYCESQVAWVKGEKALQAGFFVEWVNWCQSRAALSTT